MERQTTMVMYQVPTLRLQAFMEFCRTYPLEDVRQFLQTYSLNDNDSKILLSAYMIYYDYFSLFSLSKSIKSNIVSFMNPEHYGASYLFAFAWYCNHILDQDVIFLFNRSRKTIQSILKKKIPVFNSQYFEIFGFTERLNAYAVTKPPDPIGSGASTLLSLCTYTNLCKLAHVIRDRPVQRKCSLILWNAHEIYNKVYSSPTDDVSKILACCIEHTVHRLSATIYPLNFIHRSVITGVCFVQNRKIFKNVSHLPWTEVPCTTLFVQAILDYVITMIQSEQRKRQTVLLVNDEYYENDNRTLAHHLMQKYTKFTVIMFSSLTTWIYLPEGYTGKLLTILDRKQCRMYDKSTISARLVLTRCINVNDILLDLYQDSFKHFIVLVGGEILCKAPKLIGITDQLMIRRCNETPKHFFERCRIRGYHASKKHLPILWTTQTDYDTLKQEELHETSLDKTILEVLSKNIHHFSLPEYTIMIDESE